MPDFDTRLREVEIDLAAHLKECALKSEMVLDELRSQRRILWSAAGGILLTLVSLIVAIVSGKIHV